MTLLARPLDGKDWRDGLLWGAFLGAIVLGVGGRIAMRLAAIAVEQDVTFTWPGSATVVGAGALTGTAAAALFLGLRRIYALGSVTRIVLFWIATFGLALAILSPVNTRRLELFLPLAAIFDVALLLIWSRRR